MKGAFCGMRALPKPGGRGGNAVRGDMYTEMNRVLAAMHSVDLDAVGLTDYGKPGNYFERQLGRWTQQYEASKLQEIPAMDSLIAWLQANQPEDDGQVSLVHGDYRLDNMMWHPSKPQGHAVLDWELSTLGHPLADLAYQCMGMRMPQRGAKMAGLQGKDRTALGIPTEKNTWPCIASAAVFPISTIGNSIWRSAFFRLAAICQGVAKRAEDGNASNKQAAKSVPWSSRWPPWPCRLSTKGRKAASRQAAGECGNAARFAFSSMARVVCFAFSGEK